MVEQPLGVTLIGEAFGPYRAERLSFSTGLSTFVYARDERTGQRVVVKVFDAKPGKWSSPEGLAMWRGRFEREARLYDKVSHPRVVHPLAKGAIKDGTPYLVFPNYPATLVDEIGPEPGIASGLRRGNAPSRAVPVGRAVKVLRDMLAGLGALHAAGIVHRDVKPSNVLMTLRRGGAAVVSDLGLALSADEAGDAGGGWLGTPRYLAPEQGGDADAVDARADVYSAGRVAFRMLVGRLPESPEDRSVANAGTRCPAWLDALVADALAPDPVSRPEHAGAFLETIDWSRARGLS